MPNRCGIWASTDGGVSWEQRTKNVYFNPLKSTSLGWYRFNEFTIDPSNPHIIFASMSEPAMPKEYDATMLHSTDNGYTWDTIVVRNKEGFIKSSGAIAVLGSTIVAELWDRIERTVEIQRSTDAGKTWKKVDFDNASHDSYYSPHLFCKQGVFFMTYDSSGRRIQRSLDSGKTWIRGDAGIYEPFSVPYPALPTTALSIVETSHISHEISLAEDGKYLYAFLTDGSLYQSENKGATWNLLSSTLTGAGLHSIEFGGTLYKGLAIHNGTFFVGDSDGNLLRSTDKGLTWKYVFTSSVQALFTNNNRISNEHNIAPITSNGRTVLFATGAGIIRTTDGIAYQQVLPTDPMYYYIFTQRTMNVDMTSIFMDNNFCYAGSYSGDFVFSSDEGKTWRQMAATRIVAGAITNIAGKGGSVVATSKMNMYHSSDTGKTWQQIQAISGTTTLGVTRSAMLAGTTNGEVFRSLDSGKTWIKTLSVADTIRSFAICKIFLVALTDNGVYRSTDEGKTWEAIENDLPSGKILSSAMYRDVIFVSKEKKDLFLSLDQGKTWERERTSDSDEYTNYFALVPTDDFIVMSFRESVAYFKFNIELPQRPDDNMLVNVGPNPASDHVVISCFIDETSDVTLTVYDMLGKQVAKPIEGRYGPGKRLFDWNSSNAAAGIYMYRLQVGTNYQTGKIIITR